MVFSCYDLFKHDISQTDWKRRDLFTGILVAYSKSIGGNFDDLYSISEILYLRQDFEKVISKSHNLNYL